MKGLAIALTVAGLALGVALGLPVGHAAPSLPPKLAQLRAQVVALRANVRKLKAQNKTLRVQKGRLGASFAVQQTRDEALARHILDVDTCPITRPNGSVPRGLTGSGWHGNGSLWIEFPDPLNVVVLPRVADGSLKGTKFPWWRGVPGALRVEGKRLDAPAPPLATKVAAGFGASGIQPSVLHFPTAGCWQVTGQVGDVTLTVVTLVLGM